MATERTSFVEADLAMLRRHFDVETCVRSGSSAIVSILRGAASADVAVSWFASTYSFFMVAAARLRRRPAIIMLGGVDTARDNKIGYGIWRSRWRRPLLRWTLRHASRVVAVDASLVRSLAASSGLTDLPIDVIPTGYDPHFWMSDGERDGSVLAVAGCSTIERALVKGVDLFIEAARRMPSIRFMLVGTPATLLERFDPPANLTIVPSLSREQLRDAYGRASVLCLPSRHEGLPNALCEAMLCGCIPVGARVGGVDDAIGPCGHVVERDDVPGLVTALNAALDGGDERRRCARERIVSLFPEIRRERRLVALIEELLDA